MRRFPAPYLFGVVVLVSCTSEEGAFPGCPARGDAVRPSVAAVNRLKNRVAAPVARDIDSAVTLGALLAPGDDRGRWNERRAATVVGYVRDVKVGGVETVNCFAKRPNHRDTHIELVTDPEDGGQLPLIVEVTPVWRQHAASRGSNWSTDSLRSLLRGRWVRVTGWLLFDSEHLRQAENTAPGRVGNWRATAWELHPVTAVEVVRPSTSDPATPQ
ncbi:MAG TPA: hypothetical protein VEU73_08250 [Gemmatimonadales bacterium]|nr:hypothetical protein [Gemmatimonadales bacterium]